MLPLSYQGMIYSVRTKKVIAGQAYKDLSVETLVFNIKLPANQNVNWNGVHLCLLVNTKKHE